jgi:hypothetical protein
MYKNSVYVPIDLWLANKTRVHMETERLYRPSFHEVHKLYNQSYYDWSQNYAVHVWTNGFRNPVPKTEAEIQTPNTTAAQNNIQTGFVR